MTLLDYHRLQRDERESCDLAALERAVTAEDPGLSDRVAQLSESLAWKFTDDLCSVKRGPLFEAVERLSRIYREAEPRQRLFIRSRFWASPSRRRFTLVSFALRAAVLGIRENSLDTLRAGLAAFAIADIGPDVRDTLMSIPVLFRAAQILSPDAGDLFRESAAIAGPAFAAVLTDAAAQPASPESMGWHEVETPVGPGFRWGSPGSRTL